MTRRIYEQETLMKLSSAGCGKHRQVMMKRLLLTLLLSIICTSCNSSPYRNGRVIGKHLRMEGQDTAYVVVFYNYGVC